MRVARLSPEEGPRIVVWHLVLDVRYEAQDRRRYIVLIYPHDQVKRLEPHQARDLWYEVEEHRGCEAPCYYRHESDSAPTDCVSCRLAECLVGLDLEVRPDPIPPRLPRRPDWRNGFIVVLVALVILLLALLDVARKDNSTFERESPAPPRKVHNASGRERGAGVERGGGVRP